MSVTVLIKRVVNLGSEIQLDELYREMRSATLKQDGYIGTETKFEIYTH